MLQEISTPFYFGVAAIIFILQWMYVMFGTFRERKSKINLIKTLNEFIEEAFDAEGEAYLFIFILVCAILWPIAIIVAICVVVGSLTLQVTRTVINNRLINRINKNKIK